MSAGLAKEPSMEDILASIRRIIADEGGQPDAGTPLAVAAAQPGSASGSPQPQPAAANHPAPKPGEPPALAGPKTEPMARPEAAKAKRSLHPALEQVVAENSAKAAAIMASAQPDNAPPVSQGERGGALVSPGDVERRAPPPPPHPLRRQTDQSQGPAEDTEGAFRGALMSPSTDDSVSDSFDRLRAAMFENLDGNMEEMVRPMLREWLDNNLPAMVERLVREEIERVARGA